MNAWNSFAWLCFLYLLVCKFRGRDFVIGSRTKALIRRYNVSIYRYISVNIYGCKYSVVFMNVDNVVVAAARALSHNLELAVEFELTIASISCIMDCHASLLPTL